jgi:hypothetical protein
MKPLALFHKVGRIPGSLVRMVVPFESGWVVEEIRCFLVKGVAVQHESDGMVRLQIEMLRKGVLPGESLPVPSPERIFVGLKVEKRKPVNVLAQKGPYKSLSLGNSTHYDPRLVLND